MQGIGQFIFAGLFTIFLVAILLTAGAMGALWYFNSKDYIESKALITPEIKLVTDGHTIDTIYVYKEQK